MAWKINNILLRVNYRRVMNEMNALAAALSNDTAKQGTFEELFEKPLYERTLEQIDWIIEATKEFEFFQRMNAKKIMKDNEAHKKCCKRLKHEYHPSGTVIFREGEPPEKFYIVLRGSVNVLIQKDPNKLQEEIAMMKSKYALVYKKAIDVSSLREVGNVLITEFALIDQRKIVQLLDKEVTYPLATGGVEIKDIENIEDCFQDGVFKFTCMATIGKGNIFGELGLIRKKPRAATIMVRRDVDFGTMTKEDYETILLRMEKRKLQVKIEFFENFLPARLSADAITKFSYLFEKNIYAMNHDVYQPKDFVESIFFIKSGEVLLYEHGEIVKNKGGSTKDMSERGKNDMFVAAKLSKAEVAKVPLQQLGEGQYFGDEEIFEQKRVRKYGAVCVSARAKIYTAPLENFLQVLDQQPDLLKFFQDKARSKLIWHDNHKKFLEETKFEANQRIYTNTNLAPKEIGRITARALEKKFEKHTKKVVAVSERRLSALAISDEHKPQSLLQSLEGIGESVQKSPVNEGKLLVTELEHHSKKRKNESIRRATETNEPGIEDSIIRWIRKVPIAEKNAQELASRSRHTGVTSFIAFQQSQAGNDKIRTLSVAEAMQRKRKVESLDPNRHYHEVYSGGSTLYERVFKSAVKQLSRASRSSSRRTLTEFRIESSRLQSRDGPSNLEKARRTYSMMSLTGFSWARAGLASRQHDSSTQTPALGLHSALRTPLDSARKGGPEHEKGIKDKQQHQVVRSRNQSLAQVLDNDEDSLFEEDNVNHFDGVQLNSKIARHIQFSQSELNRTKSAAGRFHRVTYSLPVSQANSGTSTPSLQFSRRIEKAPRNTKEMMLKLGLSDPETAFMELTNSIQIRKGNYQPPPPTAPKRREIGSKAGKRSSSLKKLPTEPNSARESTRGEQTPGRELSTKESDVLEKKLRKTKHNMFRFHYKPFA